MAREENWRKEVDALGEIMVPASRLWGAKTERCRRNFEVGGQRVPMEIVRALAMIKTACAVANAKLGKLTPDKCTAIVKAAGEILGGDLKREFPLVVWQSGSGTGTNSNVNEVIAKLAENTCKLNPTDDVNMSQSTNDAFPTAIHIAAVLEIERKLKPALNELISTAKKLEVDNWSVVKVGRTHLQDATPIRFSDEISAWRSALELALQMIDDALKYVRRLAIGGTAVGSGSGSPHGFGKAVVYELNEMTQMNFREDDNKYRALSMKDSVCNLHGALRVLATGLMKMANDVRWLASGPRAGIGEIHLPENEQSSSLLPGKINPTQCESLCMVATEVMGNDTTIGMAASQGNFELNVYMPLIAFKLMESINLLADGIQSFNKNCFSGIVADKQVMRKYLESSLIMATALTPYIGYDKATELVKYAYDNNITLIKANAKLGLVASELFIELLENALKP